MNAGIPITRGKSGVKNQPFSIGELLQILQRYLNKVCNVKM